MSAEEKPVVEAVVRVVPAKRTASFDVPLGPPVRSGGVMRAPKMRAAVNAKTVTFGASSDIPKTLEAIDAVIALAQAVRAELIEQGVSE